MILKPKITFRVWKSMYFFSPNFMFLVLFLTLILLIYTQISAPHNFSLISKISYNILSKSMSISLCHLKMWIMDVSKKILFRIFCNSASVAIFWPIIFLPICEKMTNNWNFIFFKCFENFWGNVKILTTTKYV